MLCILSEACYLDPGVGPKIMLLVQKIQKITHMAQNQGMISRRAKESEFT